MSEIITVQIVYSPRRGYGIRANGKFYDFRYKPLWPRGKRTPESDAQAIRWFYKELHRPRQRLAMWVYAEKWPIGSVVVYERISKKDD